MSKSSRPGQISLPAQMTLMTVSLIILTVGAIGVPAIWLLRQQLNRQAWALVEQGGQTIQASLSANLSDLNNLAILSAQRPTLRQLLGQNDSQSLQAYLNALQSGSGLDVVAVCSTEGQIIAQAGKFLPSEACLNPPSNQTLLAEKVAEPPGWMLAAQPVKDDSGELSAGYTVLVGRALDQTFVTELRRQSGLEIILLAGERYVASSLPSGAETWQTIAGQLGDGAESRISASFTLDATPYFAIRLPFEQSDLEILAALSAASILEAQRQLTRAVGGGILLVILLGAALAFLLAKRLSQPLERLRAAAVALRKGDLETPVAARTRVREIAQVSFALEDARIALQHSLEELRKEKAWGDSLLETVVEGILTLDQRGRITFFSQGAERITGWKKSMVIGKHIDELFRLPGSDEKFSQALPEPGGKRTITAALNQGRQATLAITRAHQAPPGAGRAETALVLRDVTDEQAIRRLLGDFLANITHEFRTPLSALAASIELLIDQLPSLSQEELAELLNSLRLGTLGLQTLIDNLLEGASIEAGRFRVRPKPTNLAAVVQEAARVMQPLLEKYDQRLEIRLPDEAPLVHADARRTNQVLVNLLSNAIKWSPPGSPIILQAEIGAAEARLSVADCGPGVPPEHLEEVFTRFAHLQIENHRAEYGAGLGLSVVKTIVEAQGGRVGVENQACGGAVFWFTIPLAAPMTGQIEEDGEE